MKARALGKPLGLFSSAQNEKKATWPAYARIMFMTRPRPLTSGTAERTASTSPASGLEIPIANMATVTTAMTERQDIIDKCDTIFIVRGKPNIKHTTNPKNPN